MYGLLAHQENADRNMNIETKETTFTDIPQFSPHPKAPPREGKDRSRKRRSAILTDTPEKDAIKMPFVDANKVKTNHQNDLK